MPPLEKAARISRAKKDIKEYINQYKIVAKARENLAEDARPEEVDSDWIAHFMDKARFVSDEDIQRMWSRIMSEECNKPNSVPKSLLFIMEKMSKTDAQLFVNICRLSVEIDDEYFPIVLQEEYSKGKYNKYGIDLASLMQLDKLGLLSYEIGGTSGYATTAEIFESGRAKLTYFNKEHLFLEGIKTFQVGGVLLSKDGQALCKAVECEEYKGFWEEVLTPWLQQIEKEHIEKINLKGNA